ncbi:MAG: MATE family efflux transporter [Spartobacteria bacterium]|nr:MATE family efflux transporter [Spartobacteria bacterium]
MNEQKNNVVEWTTYGIYREVLRVAWPLIVSTGSFTVMMFCDRMFLSWYSAVAIQAALPAGILTFTLTCGFMALASYSCTFVAQYFGAGDYEGCSRSAAQGILFSLLSWPVMLALIPFGIWMLKVSGHAPEVFEAEKQYLTILMLGSVCTPLGASVSGFFAGRGKTRMPMVANVIGNAVNIVLDYAMIFGKWGFPEMGIRGAAWATVISGVISPAIMLFFYFSTRSDVTFRTRALFRYDGALFRRLLKFGLPSGVHLALDIASFTIFVLLTGRMGADAMAASNIALSINTLAFMPMIGIGIAASILVGQYQGARQPDNAERISWAAFRLATFYMIAIGLTFILFPRFYFSMFADRGANTVSLAAVLPVGRRLLVFAALWGLADAGNLVIGNALKGAGDTRFVMYYSVTLAWCMLAVGAYVIVEVLHMGITVVWFWAALYITCMAVGYILRFRSGRWKTIDVLGRKVP